MAKLTSTEATKRLIDSINKSGKQFKDIPTSAIESFLKEFGVSEMYWKSIYEEVSKSFTPKKSGANVSVKEASTNPSIKDRVPRKNILGEIVKI